MVRSWGVSLVVEPENVTLVQLIADPQKYDGKLFE